MAVPDLATASPLAARFFTTFLNENNPPLLRVAAHRRSRRMRAVCRVGLRRRPLVA